jgi:3-hydroxyisobutyrate dehydrogenase-like beta-hydroxyacid dehydrogenase
MKCGFIGLGSQGAPMAQRMIGGGLRVVLWARRPETLQPFSDTGAEFAASIEQLGAAADHVGVCVVTDADVREVCDRLIPAMRRGGRIAIHSTVHPDTCIALAKEATARGVSLIDAPVSGGSPAASVGKLTVMMGGDEAACIAARPIFETFGTLIIRLGNVGAGQMAKLVNNALMAANMALAHHALAASSALGLDRKAIAELVNASSGRSLSFEVYARLPSPSAFVHGARLLAKDVRLLREVLNTNAAAGALYDVAMPFLDIAQTA